MAWSLRSAQGFDVRVVTLPEGQDPADAPDGFEERLKDAESYIHYRVRLELERTPDRNEAYMRARDVLSRAADTPDRQEALRLLADRLQLPREMLQSIAPAGGGRAPATPPPAPRVLAAGERLERDVLAACLAHPDVLEGLREMSGDHFDNALHRRLRDHLVAGTTPAGDDLLELVAALDARAVSEAITGRTGKELMLRLHERKLQNDLRAAGGDLVRATELQVQLARVRRTLGELM